MKGVVHCFSGNRDELDQYLSLGLHIGITGILTIKSRGAKLRQLVPGIPTERLLVETENGMREEIILTPVTPQGANNMLRGMDIGPPGVAFVSAFTNTQTELPLYMTHLDGHHNYWFVHDEERRTIRGDRGPKCARRRAATRVSSGWS